MTIKVRPCNIDGEQWTVQLDGDELEIVDPTGKSRHKSKGHAMAGVHLAMAIAELDISAEYGRQLEHIQGTAAPNKDDPPGIAAAGPAW